MASQAQFEAWLLRFAHELPVVKWGPDHTKIALAFAQYCESMAVNYTLGEALNSGDGTYKP